ncbi:ABC-type dipeptide/oligopeptide/nickel transport systems, permease components [Microbacterium testaceum StLB037]|jgi:peptide/nickel transport system permease protein|uniref:ABC-type dipeptide/oligopeptide/nickel transport systems, permease components n=1 Tax=Microbacterium testaceum (strain StLB037) TaxID=979556 RepID=E8NCK1_MICTS|nr:ABC transporter permease [Microbacterium testaceum]MDF2666512.1 ABC-type dipeptide/oligopeptide/nickel transport system, permease component [Microbacterium sp.]BAJ74870.1 ABC-type dipeptide/oligopeptide/nickel transport systems, permease components [Microbacterium testaceum StLB037]
MSEMTVPTTTSIEAAAARTVRPRLWRRLLHRPIAVVALILLLVMAGAALLAPVLAGDPNAFVAVERLRPPSATHIFGTDNLGRDVYSRTVFGAQASLTVGVVTAAITTAIGVVLGILAGMFRWFDAIVMRIVDGVMSFPIIVLALAMTAILGPGLGTVILAMTIVFVPGMTRVVRSSALVASELPMVDSARAIGAGSVRIFWRYILPQATTPVLVQAAITFTTAVLVESALSFIGAGLPPNVPSWGASLSEARSYLTSAVWMWGFPGLALILTVLAMNIVIDNVRDILDPRAGGR